ncbi:MULTISPECIES: hypothetical protein [unclassified Microbulbifer]|uniref:hypothetical protein n=1 Tax=unclassified Microbulbifer TaxID=2619833 RepID=UPI0027E3FDF1|nr:MULTISPECIES: hypothetical protein [unclassified Microbulbifer]
MLLTYLSESSVVFCDTKRETQEVANILGEHGFSAPTGEDGIASDEVGKIKVQDAARVALQKLSAGKLKGRSFRARRVT